MQGSELTYAILRRTRNEAAVDVLLSALNGSADCRELALKTLQERSEPSTPVKLLSIWSSLGERDFEILRNRKTWFSDAIRAALQRSGDDAITAIAASESLQMTILLPTLVDLAESAPNEAIRDRASETIVVLSDQLGKDARADHDLPTVRYPALTRLADSISNFSAHRNERLVDAFLLLSSWGDNDLRRIQQVKGKSYRVLCERFATSQHSGVLTLLAGFLRRRNLDEQIAELIRDRSDETFRDVFLAMVGAEPSATVLKNLAIVGVPRCCRDGESIVEEIGDNNLPALVQLYVAANANYTETLHVIASTAERGNATCDSIAAFALSRCQSPSEECLLRASLHVVEDDETTLANDENARLLKRLIALLDHSDDGVVQGVRQVLEPLHASAMMVRFESLRPRSRRLLGRVVMMIDPDAIQRVGDGLRHPVLSRRLDAIAMADALSVVDLLSDSFAHISREDHQEARMRAADVMANASGAATMGLLKDLTQLPHCPVRDVAVNAFRRRQQADNNQGLEQ